MKAIFLLKALFFIVSLSALQASAFSWECYYTHDKSESRVQIIETTLEQRRASTEYVRGGDNSPKFDNWISASHVNRDKTSKKLKGFYNFNLASKIPDLLREKNPQIKVVPGYHAVKSATKIVLRTDANSDGTARQVTVNLRSNGTSSVDLHDVANSGPSEIAKVVATGIPATCRR